MGHQGYLRANDEAPGVERVRRQRKRIRFAINTDDFFDVEVERVSGERTFDTLRVYIHTLNNVGALPAQTDVYATAHSLIFSLSRYFAISLSRYLCPRRSLSIFFPDALRSRRRR